MTYKPIHAIFLEIEVLIIVHWIVWARSLEINNISTHPMLELDSIFSSNKASVLMVVVQKVV